MKIHKLPVGELRTNCYIVLSRKNNAFIIDPGDEVERIRAVLGSEGAQALFIVDTHAHIDHIKANAALKLPVYIHEKEADAVSDPDRNLSTLFLGLFEPVTPARLLRDADEIVLDELKFEVFHTPGHTAGGICLYGHGVLFSGDTLFFQGVGRTDLSDSNATLMDESLERLGRLPAETVVYPGHGPQTTIGREYGSLG